ncbi:MAG: DNA-directed RNA polymerase subunit beta, partial [bacterium]
MEKNRIKPIQLGDVIRMSYSRIDEVLEMPNLLALQKDSYNWFIEEGLKEVFEDISPIIDHSNNLILEFVGFNLDSDPRYSIPECKERDTTYATALRVKTRLINKKDDEIKEQEIFMGDFPLMTDTGTFVINGAERVIVSQLVRSPGIYYAMEKDKKGKNLISSTVIPNRGAWLEYETDSNNIFHVRVDRNRKLPVTTLIRALGISSNEEIIDFFGEDPKILATIEKDISTSWEEGLIEVYKKIRPGEPPTVESAQSLLHSMFYDPKRYDLARVGRYKFNKKLSYRNRIIGFTLSSNVIDPTTGELISIEGEKVTQEIAIRIQNAGISFVDVYVQDNKSLDNSNRRSCRVIGNLAVDIEEHIIAFDLTKEEVGILEDVYYPVLLEILESAEDKEDLKEKLQSNMARLMPKHITLEDILASMNYNIGLDYGVGGKDDIDHLGNRRIRAVGELLQNQFRIGLSRMERVVKERMNTQALETVTPQALINIKPVTASIKEFFGSSQLSQFMDQNNPLSEMTHKRRLSALGPGGLSRDRAGFEVRDVHTSHYGRMCPIETPEGPNIGLINSLATFASINQYGFIEAPYRKIDKSGDKPRVINEFIYVTADEEENYIIAQANEPLNENGEFVNAKVTCRLGGEDNTEIEPEKVDLMDVSPKQLVSVATSLIPFLENDDVTRALMGSNMQRQAVPLLTTDAPVIGTGMEHKTAKDSGVVIVAENDGYVDKLDASEIVVKLENGSKDRYKLSKFKRSNQSNCMNQRPIVSKGQRIKAGDIIADGPSTKDGELALGKNPLIGFMTWEGYNYEDAVLLSEKLVADDVYTSIHIEEYECEARDTKLGPEEITRDIPNVGDDALRDLTDGGIIRVGAEVNPNDILVGKVTPKGETELTAEERLLRAIFGEKAREVRDSSLRVPHGECGIIVDIKKFSRENGDELPPGVNKLVRVYIAQKRKISVGDKMAGRHGNKGVVSRVLPVEDMPFLPNGRPLDIVLNPLGVPSRMNIGQVLEIHLSLAAKVLDWKIATPVFDGASEDDIMETLQLANDYANFKWEDFESKWKDNLNEEIFEGLRKNREHRDDWKGVTLNSTGKIKLRDGRTGEEFDNPTTVGFMHYLKLHHLVDDKIHARSTGPYSLVTQQPLGGKAQFGGQRFGEMEVWALEAYGASYTLQEILTVKSDDVVGRVKTYEAIVKGENIPEPGIPESFKVLLKELQALGLDIRVLLDDKTEIEIKESIETSEILELNVNIEGNEDDDSESFEDDGTLSLDDLDDDLDDEVNQSNSSLSKKSSSSISNINNIDMSDIKELEIEEVDIITDMISKDLFEELSELEDDLDLDLNLDLDDDDDDDLDDDDDDDLDDDDLDDDDL